MKKTTLYLLFFIFGYSISQESFDQKKDEAYIQKFAKIAVEEMQKNKIPASIKLGQGLLETGDGQSELAKNANNHFGIKCKETWQGETYRYTDDAYMECFRKYPTAEDSYRDHSQFLLTRKHYAPLFSYPSDDYKAWAYGLKKAGYATNKRYPQILISKIERYNLQYFDKLKPEEVGNYLSKIYNNYKEEKKYSEPDISKNKVEEAKLEPKKVILNKEIEKITEIPVKNRIKEHKNNDLKYFVISKGDTVKKISAQTGISIEDLMEYNDLKNPTQIAIGQNFFLEEKRKKGIEKYYIAAKGDTMYLISQKEGIRLERLCDRNEVNENYQPKVGEQIYLRGSK